MADTKNVYDFEIGDKVRHSKWGIGTVLMVTGNGERTKVTVMFQDGTKMLMAQYANLEKVASAPVKRNKSVEPFLSVPEDEVAFGPVGAELPADLPEVEDEDDDLVVPPLGDGDSAEEDDDDTL